MTRKNIIPMSILLLFIITQLSFAEQREMVPIAQGKMVSSSIESEGQLEVVQTSQTATGVVISSSEQPHEQTAPMAVMVPQPEQQHEQKISIGMMVQQSEQQHKQTAPVPVMTQPHEQAAPMAGVMVQEEQAASVAVTAQQRVQQYGQVAVKGTVLNQPREAKAPLAVVIPGSAKPIQATVVRQESRQIKVLPPMSVAISGKKMAGPQPKAVKAVSAIAFQATQKK